MLKGLVFREMPSYAEVIRMDNFPKFTFGQMYDFSVGDEFEYIAQCSNWMGSSQPPSYSYYRINQKWYSANMDSVFYQRTVQTLGLTFVSFPTPHLDSTFTWRSDTMVYTNLNDTVYDAEPEENTTQRFLPPQDFGVYLMEQQSALYNNRMVYAENSGYYGPVDSCMYLNHFEGLYNEIKLSPGLGIVKWGSDYRAIGQDYCEYHMFWYHKGAETWGTYADISAVTDLFPQPQFVVYPNPVTTECVIQLYTNKNSTLSVYALDGRCVLVLPLKDERTIVQMKELAAGVFNFVVRYEDGVSVR
jgi:hypothetical protein